ncbi:MAG: glycoside hydrolase family 18 protein [Candidatus Blackburnbacteria bacterium]|nr:glycoside hydrolase family 18 protein [Candidatus Blackburnbacteria bacterium]
MKGHSLMKIPFVVVILRLLILLAKVAIYRTKHTPLLPDNKHAVGIFWGAIAVIFILILNSLPYTPEMLSPLGKQNLKPLTEEKDSQEVFGFAPYWTINKLENVDFNVLTTLAYFGVPVKGDGNLDKRNQGYTTFKSDSATEVFLKAHERNTRIVLTLTQMNNGEINRLLENPAAQKRAIDQAVNEVRERGIDGVNIDFEYVGNPGQEKRSQFTNFVASLTNEMKKAVPHSKVTVSVYASSARDPKIYEIGKLAKVSDGIFMMAYDFATTNAEVAMPTAPLYGHKEGKYWYDISTAVDDFLKEMQAEKLILGLPWYGYNYPVYEPGDKAETRRGYYVYSWVKTKKGKRQVRNFISFPRHAQTYELARGEVLSDQPGFKTGWDELGQVGWSAYLKGGIWRMIFLEDAKSLGIKYDFAKSKSLGGVGMWALGFDSGSSEMWKLLNEKFGVKQVGGDIARNENNI